MNDQELKDRLNALKIPGCDERARDRALHRATVALANAEEPKNEARLMGWTGRLLWTVGCAMAAAVIFVSLQAPVPLIQPKAQELADDLKILKQMEALFPGQIDAVIQKSGAVNLELAAEQSLPSDQPILVRLISGKQSIQIMSYSGRKVCVELEGSRTCFEALLNNDGNVILNGRDFIWTPQLPVTVAGYRIEAKKLSPAS